MLLYLITNLITGILKPFFPVLTFVKNNYFRIIRLLIIYRIVNVDIAQ